MIKGISVLLAVLLLSFGCAQSMAVKQPGPLDRSFLIGGTPHSRVTAMLGPSYTSVKEEDSLEETYVYTDGGAKNSAGGKTARVILYTAGDLFTVFLSQIIWMPMELLMEGDKYSAEVEYVKNQEGKWVVDRAVETQLEGAGKRRVIVGNE